MDNSREFDLDRIMEQIRLKVRDNRQMAPAAPAAENDQAPSAEQLQIDLAQLHQAYDLSRVPINADRKTLGWSVLSVAKAFGALLGPLIRRQSEYNAANTRLTTHLKGQMDELLPQFVKFRNTLGDYEKQFRGFGEALVRRFAAMHAADFAMHSQALRDLSQKVEAIEGRFDEQSRQFQVYHSQISSQVEATYAQIGEQVEARHSELRGEFEARYSELRGELEAARSHIEELKPARERLMRVERRLRRLLSGETPDGVGASHPASEPPPAASAEMDYAGFEERLRRGETVKEKQRDYVKYFAGQGTVVDVGCGRGEFLELMGEAGIAAKGLDLDLDMILLCKEKGLDVERCDAIHYLAEQPDGLLGGIFSAQVIEHLTPAQLTGLITVAWRKLKPGGTIVLETLNPESIFVHYRWFWMDPSHVRLVHPETLRFLMESAGFVEVCCRFLTPPAEAVSIPPLQTGVNGSLDEFNRATAYLNKLLYGSWEYAMIARK